MDRRPHADSQIPAGGGSTVTLPSGSPAKLGLGGVSGTARETAPVVRAREGHLR